MPTGTSTAQLVAGAARARGQLRARRTTVELPPTVAGGLPLDCLAAQWGAPARVADAIAELADLVGAQPGDEDLPIFAAVVLDRAALRTTTVDLPREVTGC